MNETIQNFDKHPQMILVRKRTRWELDLERYGSEENVKKLYQNQNKSLERIYNSHRRQIENFEKIKKANLPHLQSIHIEDLPKIDRKHLELLISFGGDNHFIYISRFTHGVPILGLNSDTETSTGALLHYNTDSFIDAFSNSKTQNLKIIHYPQTVWSGIRCQLKQQNSTEWLDLGCCTSEFSIRSAFSDYISSFIIRKNKEEWEDLRSSGYLLSTGAGSSGWYSNAHRRGQEMVFPKEASFFRGLAREIELKYQNRSRYMDIEIKENETLEIISDMEGEISIDAHPEWLYPFPVGAKAIFTLVPKYLKVLINS